MENLGKQLLENTKNPTKGLLYTRLLELRKKAEYRAMVEFLKTVRKDILERGLGSPLRYSESAFFYFSVGNLAELKNSSSDTLDQPSIRLLTEPYLLTREFNLWQTMVGDYGLYIIRDRWMKDFYVVPKKWYHKISFPFSRNLFSALFR